MISCYFLMARPQTFFLWPGRKPSFCHIKKNIPVRGGCAYAPLRGKGGERGCRRQRGQGHVAGSSPQTQSLAIFWKTTLCQPRLAHPPERVKLAGETIAHNKRPKESHICFLLIRISPGHCARITCSFSRCCFDFFILHLLHQKPLIKFLGKVDHLWFSEQTKSSFVSELISLFVKHFPPFFSAIVL